MDLNIIYNEFKKSIKLDISKKKWYYSRKFIIFMLVDYL